MFIHVVDMWFASLETLFQWCWSQQGFIPVAPETSDDSTIYVKAGDDVSISCTIIANPEPAHKWYIEGNQVTGLISMTATSNKNEYVSVLTITGIGDARFGDYQCSASNLLGTDSTTFHLFKQGNAICSHVLSCCVENQHWFCLLVVPSTPERVLVTFVSHSVITVQWVAPFDGGVPIDYFIIRYRHSGNQWQRELTTGLSYMIRNLEPHTSYTIEVAAQNDIGIGLAAVQTAVTHRMSLYYWHCRTAARTATVCLFQV